MATNPLGINDKDLQDVGSENTVVGVLQNFGNKIQKELRQNLQDELNTVTSKSLEQSIIFDIQVLGSGYSFELKMNDYWKFVDKGVQGVGGIKSNNSRYSSNNSTSPYSYTDKKPPISSIQEWSYYQGQNPFVAQNSIYHKGTKATNFYSDLVDQSLINKLTEELAEAGAREINISLKNSFNGNSDKNRA